MQEWFFRSQNVALTSIGVCILHRMNVFTRCHYAHSGFCSPPLKHNPKCFPWETIYEHYGTSKTATPYHMDHPPLKHPEYVPCGFRQYVSKKCSASTGFDSTVSRKTSTSTGFDSTSQEKLWPLMVLITCLKKTLASLPVSTVCIHWDIHTVEMGIGAGAFVHFVLFDLESDWTDLNWYFAILSLIWFEASIVAALRVFSYDWGGKQKTLRGLVPPQWESCCSWFLSLRYFLSKTNCACTNYSLYALSWHVSIIHKSALYLVFARYYYNSVHIKYVSYVLNYNT